jgi:hypothetical protein
MPMNAAFLVERQGKQFALYAGLLDLAHQEGLRAITTELVQVPTEANGQVAICRATVVTEKGTFTGFGDACPTNVTRMMVPHLVRLAETRAKARALRDAVNVGMAAVEELGPDVTIEDEPGAPLHAPATSPRTEQPRQAASTTAGAPAPQVGSAPDGRLAGTATPPAADRTRSAPPSRPLAVAKPSNQATEPQLRLLRELAQRLDGRAIPSGLTMGQASELIDHWKAGAAQAARARTPETGA